MLLKDKKGFDFDVCGHDKKTSSIPFYSTPSPFRIFTAHYPFDKVYELVEDL